jgi:lipopolysaccharide assembly protein A
MPFFFVYHAFNQNRKVMPMILFSRIFAFLLFLLFFSFALKNTNEVALHFFLQYEIRGPLVLMLLGFFFAGATLGVFAMAPMVFRYRRDLVRCKSSLDALQQAKTVQASPKVTQPDMIRN